MGLPYGLTKEQFYKGFSKPGNAKLMRIFNQLDIVDHTGHGIPIIVDKYVKDSFEISNNYIMVTIPFDKEVMVTINVGVNDVEKVILEELVNL